jgi:recombinational DNA repair protein (RecF pathway)
MDSFYKKFFEFFTRYFGLESAFAAMFNRASSLSDSVLLIFSFLLLLLVFSLNSL